MTKIIKHKLNNKGFEIIGESNTRKIIKRFEENVLSKNLFDMFYANPILRILAQYTFEKGLAQIFETTQNIVRLDLQNLIKPILKVKICENCGQKVFYFDEEKPPKDIEIKCSSCHHKHIRTEDTWEITIREIVDYFNVFNKIGVAKKVLSCGCPNCFQIKNIPEFSYDDFIKNRIKKNSLKELIFCDKCRALNEIIWAYMIDENIREPWKSGVWLEWYVKSILKNKLKIKVEQGILVRDKQTKNQIEVDGLFLKNNKLFSLECKALSLDKRAEEDEVKDVIKLFDFSDKIIFVTTAKIGENIKQRYRKLFEKRYKGNLIFIEGKEIEDIPKLLKNAL